MRQAAGIPFLDCTVCMMLVLSYIAMNLHLKMIICPTTHHAIVFIKGTVSGFIQKHRQYKQPSKIQREHIGIISRYHESDHFITAN